MPRLVIGSSPLARGLPDQPPDPPGGVRIIPARAGFTRPRRRTSSRMSGSSPLARGLQFDVEVVSGQHRIIPARAGFTQAVEGQGDRLADHPRSRGVYSQVAPRNRAAGGSSPLARGLLSNWRRLCGAPGIIPARAGFTAPPPSGWRGDRDHPRSRGVYCRALYPRDQASGSSPLARGLRHDIVVGVGPRRIIPARAGFTPNWDGSTWPGRDHPRSRGVYSRTRPQTTDIGGSSPLARGLLPTTNWIVGSRRIIPARAGFTYGSRHS